MEYRKMTTIKTEKYILPSYWATYLFNYDVSDMTIQEVGEINKFLRERKLGTAIDYSTDSWFQHSNDCNRIAGDVMEYTFIIGEEE